MIVRRMIRLCSAASVVCLRRPLRESLWADSLDSRRIDVRSALRGLSAKIFSQALGMLDASSSDARAAAHALARERYFAASTEHRTCQKPIFHRAFSSIARNSSTQRSVICLRQCVARSRSRAASTQHVVSMRMRARFVKRRCCFFCRAVVIRVQCSRFPRALSDIATHSWLGGQHGEEGKTKTKSAAKKGEKQDKAPEEEVSTRRFSVFGFEQCR